MTIIAQTTIVPLRCKDKFAVTAVDRKGVNDNTVIHIECFDTAPQADAALERYLKQHPEAQPA
jgi:hypothetical protein